MRGALGADDVAEQERGASAIAILTAVTVAGPDFEHFNPIRGATKCALSFSALFLVLAGASLAALQRANRQCARRDLGLCSVAGRVHLH
jgi:hypothetical protein